MKFIDPGFKGNNPGHYSTAVVSNGMLYVSGLLSMDPDTREVCTGNIEAHAAQALQNLDRVLKAAGVERSQVVFCRVYTPSNEYWGPINHQWVLFGRETCIARRPKCADCFISDLCPSCPKDLIGNRGNPQE